MSVINGPIFRMTLQSECEIIAVFSPECILFQPKILKWNIYIFKIGNQAPKISVLIKTIKESIPVGVDRAKIQQWIDLKWPETKL